MKPVHYSMLLTLACWAGAAHAAHLANQTIRSSRIVAAARAILPPAKPGTKVTLRVIGAPPDAAVPMGAVRLQPQPVAGRWPRQRAAVSVWVSVDGKVARTETVWFAIRAMRTVLVYGLDAAAGTPVKRLKFTKADVDIANVSGDPVEKLASLSGERLGRGVHAGWPLQREDFEPIPAVDRRSQVVVHVRYGPIRIDTLARAMGTGDVGDTVPVLIEGAASPVLATIVGKGAVDIAR